MIFTYGTSVFSPVFISPGHCIFRTRLVQAPQNNACVLVDEKREFFQHKFNVIHTDYTIKRDFKTSSI
jgi:hypothetical protein